MWTQQRLEFQGLDVQLFCRAEGTPTPAVRWFDNNGEEIEEDNNAFTVSEQAYIRTNGIHNFSCILSIRSRIAYDL